MKVAKRNSAGDHIHPVWSQHVSVSPWIISAAVKATCAAWAQQIQGPSTATGISPLSLGHRTQGDAGWWKMGSHGLGWSHPNPEEQPQQKGKQRPTRSTAKLWYPVTWPQGYNHSTATGPCSCQLKLTCRKDLFSKENFPAGKMSPFAWPEPARRWQQPCTAGLGFGSVPHLPLRLLHAPVTLGVRSPGLKSTKKPSSILWVEVTPGKALKAELWAQLPSLQTSWWSRTLSGPCLLTPRVFMGCLIRSECAQFFQELRFQSSGSKLLTFLKGHMEIKGQSLSFFLSLQLLRGAVWWLGQGAAGAQWFVFHTCSCWGCRLLPAEEKMFCSLQPGMLARAGAVSFAMQSLFCVCETSAHR